jgi:hypothetical protein
LKTNTDERVFPYELFPVLPGLHVIGAAPSPIAFFYLIDQQKPNWAIVTRTFQKRWITFQDGLLAFLVALLTDLDSVWEGCVDSKRKTSPSTWTFITEAGMSTPEKQLQEAVRVSDKARIQKLTATGADVNTKDSEGNTLLCSTEDPEIIQLLLSLGADPNVACDDGTTPLIVAVMGRTALSAIRALLNAGANPNTPGGFGMTPLMHASGNREIEVVKCLLSAGADVTAVDTLGKSALHAARKRPDVWISCFHRSRSRGN